MHTVYNSHCSMALSSSLKLTSREAAAISSCSIISNCIHKKQALTYQRRLVILESLEPLVDGFGYGRASICEPNRSMLALTLRGLEHASAAQQLAGRPRAAILRTRAGRGGGQLRAYRARGGAHGGAEVGGPAAAIAAGSGGDARAGGSKARHVERKRRTASRRRVGLARIKRHVPRGVQRCLDKTSGACRSRKGRRR